MIKIRNLTKSYGEKIVLKDINIKVKKGEKVVIIGPSGSGKSTLLRCINFLELHDKGEIYFKGKIVNKDLNINLLRQKVGMVFQNFNLFNNLNVLENITLAPINLKLKSKEEAEKSAVELLKRINLLDKAKQYPKTLSGGEKQRVAIVRALAMEPEVLLFDEPTSALDPEMVQEVLNLMKEIADEGMTMIIVTHEMGFAKEIGNKIIFMEKGSIIEQGNKVDFFEKTKNQRLKQFLSKVK